MASTSIRQSLHEIIDEIEDMELLNLHLLLLQKETQRDFFSPTDDEMLARAKQSLKSVKEGKTRSLRSFREEVTQWKRNQAT